MQDVDYFQTFAPTPSSASVKILAAVANEHGLEIFHLDVAEAFVRAKLDAEIYMKLPGGYGDVSGNIWSKEERTAVGRIISSDCGRVQYGAV